MTPPLRIRNFFLGSSHPLPDLALNPPAEARLQNTSAAISSQQVADAITREQATDSILMGPATRYRESLGATYRDYTVERLEAFIQQSLALGRAGQRVSYYDTLAAHFSLLQRVPADRVATVSRQFVAAVEEYSNFLQNASGLSTEERMRYLFAAARILHTFWGFLERPPGNFAAPPEAPELRRLLRQTLDEVDGQLQGYRGRLQSEGFPDLSRLDGVMEILALRRAMHAGDADAQRSHALALAGYLRQHPPLAADMSWEARGERALLEDPEVLQQLQRFDIPSLLEYRSTSLNAYSLELLVLTAASLDRANEASENLVQGRYRRLSAVLTVAILRHPEATLEEQLNRLANPTEEAALVAEVLDAESSSADLSHMIHEARDRLGLAELVVAARESALHLRELRNGLGARLIPGILETNRRYHPLHAIAAQLQAQPSLADALHLPALHPERELLRRGIVGQRQVEAFQEQNHLSLRDLLRLLSSDGNSPHPAEDVSRDLLEAWQEQLHSGADHETFALYSLTHAVAENRDLGNGVRLSGELRNRAQGLGARIDSFEFRSRRVLGHLFSATNWLSMGAGVLAAEFLPSLLIARAGATGSLALRGVSLVSAGTLTPWGSVATGLGTGLATTLIGTTASTLERRRLGLQTHWGRDFLTSGAINLATFGLTLPAANLLRRGLMPNRLASGEITALSMNRRLILHGGTVAIGGATAWGLGYLGRGLTQGQWRVSGEEIAENLGSILLWEGGATGLRAWRARTSLSQVLGPYRLGRVPQVADLMIGRNGSLAEHRETLIRYLGREEYYNPGTLDRFAAAQESNYMPILTGSGPSLRLRMLAPNRIPAGSAASVSDAPPNPPPQDRYHVLIWERDRVLRLPASTSAETPLQQASSATVEEPHLPVALEDSPFVFEVARDAAASESNGLINFKDLTPIEGGNSRILGRSNFRFLSSELQRTISRAHLEVFAEDGAVLVRNMSRLQVAGEHNTGAHGSWILRDNNWQPIPSDRPMSLMPGDEIAIGNRMELVRFQMRPNATPPLSLVTLGPGGQLRFGGMTVVRSGEGSRFRMGGPGGIPVTLTRSLGPEAGRPQVTPSLDHPLILGEIGEEVHVTIGEGASRRTYLLRLNAPDRPAAWLPTVDLRYAGTDGQAHFTATQGEVSFGKLHQPELFQAPYISRNHFDLKIISQNGHPRYGLTVNSKFGLFVHGSLMPQGTRLALHAGHYIFGFPMDNSGRSETASPLNLRLPPIDGVFEEWNAGPLVPNHDRGVAPPAPPPAAPGGPVTMPPPPPNSTAR